MKKNNEDSNRCSTFIAMDDVVAHMHYVFSIIAIFSACTWPTSIENNQCIKSVYRSILHLCIPLPLSSIMHQHHPCTSHALIEYLIWTTVNLFFDFYPCSCPLELSCKGSGYLIWLSLCCVFVCFWKMQHLCMHIKKHGIITGLSLT